MHWCRSGVRWVVNVQSRIYLLTCFLDLTVKIVVRRVRTRLMQFRAAALAYRYTLGTLTLTTLFDSLGSIINLGVKFCLHFFSQFCPGP